MYGSHFLSTVLKKRSLKKGEFMSECIKLMSLCREIIKDAPGSNRPPVQWIYDYKKLDKDTKKETDFTSSVFNDSSSCSVDWDNVLKGKKKIDNLNICEKSKPK